MELKDIPQIPPWIVAALAENESVQGPGIHSAEVLAGVPEGQRDECLFKWACKLRREDIPRPMAETLILEAAANCTPPFPRDQALAKVRNAYTQYEPHPASAATPMETLGERSEELPFRRASDIARETPEEPDWVWEGFLARGATTEIDAKVKAGKTTLVAASVAAILQGERFLERPTRAGPIVYLSEELDAVIQAELQRCGLTEADDLHYLRRVDAAHLPWAEIVTDTIRYAQSIQATTIVVDTLSAWAGIRGDEENSSGAALAAMAPLQQAAAAGFAVLAVRHDRKSGGELGDSARGSSAFSGAADIVLQLRRANTQGHPNRRELLGVGRLPGIPDQLVIEWTGDTYILVGEAIDVERQEACQSLLDTLPFEGEGFLSEEQLREELDVSRTTLRRALDDLRATGQVDRDQCAGKTGRAYGYWLVKGVTSPRTPGQSHSKGDEVNEPRNGVTALGKTPGHKHYQPSHVSESDVPSDLSFGAPESENPREMAVTSPLPLGGQSIATGTPDEDEETL